MFIEFLGFILLNFNVVRMVSGFSVEFGLNVLVIILLCILCVEILFLLFGLNDGVFIMVNILLFFILMIMVEVEFDW